MCTPLTRERPYELRERSSEVESCMRLYRLSSIVKGRVFFFVFFSDTNPIRDRFLVGGRHESVPMRLLNRCWEKEKQACYLCRSWRFVVRKLVSKTVGSYFQAVDDLLVWLKSTQLLIDWKLNDRDSLKTFARLGLLGYVYVCICRFNDISISYLENDF